VIYQDRKLSARSRLRYLEISGSPRFENEDQKKGWNQRNIGMKGGRRERGGKRDGDSGGEVDGNREFVCSPRNGNARWTRNDGREKCVCEALFGSA